MFTFIGKTIKAPEQIPKLLGKRVKVKAIWKNGKFVGRVDNKTIVEIDGWDDLTNCKWIYALPTNTYFTPWHRKPYMPPEQPDKDVLEMTLRFWGKYWHNMTIYGKIVNGVFYQSKSRNHESVISETISQ